MLKTKNEILSILINELHNHSEVVFAYIFGSFVESDHFNDIDLAIYLEQNKIERWYDIELSIELEKKIGLPVDIIILNKAPDHLIYEVSKGKILIDKNEDFRIDFVTSAWKRYFDFKPKRMEYIRQISEIK
jgi:predicted nucleotidyltransferase